MDSAEWMSEERRVGEGLSEGTEDVKSWTRKEGQNKDRPVDDAGERVERQSAPDDRVEDLNGRL